MKQQEKIEELLTRGTEQIIVKDSLAKKLASGKALRVKLGVDPTAPKLHLGHTVVLRKLKQFQELGHHIIFLVGDFTARIGDPTDRLSARKPLTEKEIQANFASYKTTVAAVLDIDKVEIRYNSEWHTQMDFAELFRVMSFFTVNQMLERDMFQERMKKQKPLWIHELTYPILQGYDSVALKADVELGGTDQTFNVLAAREIQPKYHQPPQDIMTMALLEGTDGKEKMSKSVGNTIDLDDSPNDMFGKLMSVPDELIIKYFTLLTDVPMNEIKEMEQEMKGGDNPKNAKVLLAKELVTLYHNATLAQKAEEEFTKIFSNKEAPSAIPKFAMAEAGDYVVADMIVETKLAPSKSEAKRLIEQGGVTFAGKKVKAVNARVQAQEGDILQVGKRKFVQLTLKK